MRIMILMGKDNDHNIVGDVLRKNGWKPNVIITDTYPGEVNGAKWAAFFRSIPCRDTDISTRPDYEYELADYADALIVLCKEDYAKRMLRIMRSLDKPCVVEDF